MKANPLPDLNYLKEYVELDPSIPHGLRRKKSNIQFTGKPCGCKDGWKSSQYYHFTLNGSYSYIVNNSQKCISFPGGYYDVTCAVRNGSISHLLSK